MSSLSARTALRRFIQVNTETPDEVRGYVRENVVELARDFGVTEDTITTAIAGVSDDAALAVRLLGTLRSAEATLRANKRKGRAAAAQVAANALASTTTFEDGRAQLDILPLLATVLTKRADLLVFTCDDFTVDVHQGPLFDIARLKRRDLTAFVDAEGLHLRWRGGRGGLNLRSHADPHADRIVLNLSRTTVASAA